MIACILPTRKPDRHGAGHYGASRGTRTHRGIDLAAQPGSLILSNVDGVVTKLGYPYADHLEYRYVEITAGLIRHRFFYVEPLVNFGQDVAVGDIIGEVQDLSPLYEGITPHIHYEQKMGNKYLDPTGDAT